MPQTHEHLAIMDLLKIQHGVFALTKIDRVSDSRVSDVEQQIKTMISDTSLSSAAVMPVSAHSGKNIADLSKHLLHLSKIIPARSAGGRFRMAIDRNFVDLHDLGFGVIGEVTARRPEGHRPCRLTRLNETRAKFQRR